VIAINGKTLRRRDQKKVAKAPIHMISASAARRRPGASCAGSLTKSSRSPSGPPLPGAALAAARSGRKEEKPCRGEWAGGRPMPRFLHAVPLP